MEVDGGEWERDENEVEQKGSQLKYCKDQTFSLLRNCYQLRHSNIT